MKSVMMMMFLAANLALFAQQADKAAPKDPKQCLKMDEEDGTDALAIPLDEDGFDQCVELEKLEQGKKAQ